MKGGPSALYLGLMSGTSVDGIDAALTEIDGTGAGVKLIAARAGRIHPELRGRILALTETGRDEIDRLGQLDVEIGELFARTAEELLDAAGVEPEKVSAIGSHGQTVRHRPHGKVPFTLQIGDPNTIAERTGITTVADFRRRDIVAGGQGAPLVPAFHAAIFRSDKKNRAIVNIGGMANVTILPANPSGKVMGFDTGPGNVFLDAWHERHHGTAIDLDGIWARTGSLNPSLLDRLLEHPFLRRPPPKSTGREEFGICHLDELLRDMPERPEPSDVQATLAEFTARTITDAITRWATACDEIYLCGGGAHNGFLCERLAATLPDRLVESTSSLGVDPDWVEAMAFAWLAHRTLKGLTGNLPDVTGASHPVVLGGIYPGRTVG